MTEPADYVTDGEIAKRMRVGINSGRKALQKMRQHPKFPPKTIGGKRYWPSVAAFLHFWNGLTLDVPGIPAGQENDHGQTSHSGRRRPSLEATKEWLGSGLAVPPGYSKRRIQTGDPPDRGDHPG